MWKTGQHTSVRWSASSSVSVEVTKDRLADGTFHPKSLSDIGAEGAIGLIEFAERPHVHGDGQLGRRQFDDVGVSRSAGFVDHRTKATTSPSSNSKSSVG